MEGTDVQAVGRVKAEMNKFAFIRATPRSCINMYFFSVIMI